MPEYAYSGNRRHVYATIRGTWDEAGVSMEDMIEFTKSHGIGNDFIIIEDFAGAQHFSPHAIRLLCDRYQGIGADGLILARPSDHGDAYMVFFNSDGSQAEMCGNGIRCLAKMLYDRGYTASPVVDIETLDGVKPVELLFVDAAVVGARVSMGKARFRAADIPMEIDDPDAEAIEIPLTVGQGTVTVSCANVGNPHCVVFVDDVRDAPVREIGAYLSQNAVFPERTNVEFVHVASERELVLRVFERGAGETLACGTGACAAVAIADRLGYIERRARVRLPGGTLDIEISPSGELVMAGPADEVCVGFLSLEFMTRLEMTGGE